MLTSGISDLTIEGNLFLAKLEMRNLQQDRTLAILASVDSAKHYLSAFKHLSLRMLSFAKS